MRMVAATSGDAPNPMISERETSLGGLAHHPVAAKGLAALMRQAPPLVVAGRDSATVLPVAVYCLLRRRTRLLVWAETAPRSWQLARRLALYMADAVLVNGEAAEAAVTRAGKPARAVFNVPGPYAIEGFLHQPAGRSAEAAHRLVVCGGLSPDSDSMHILASAAAWAERNPARLVELCWVGDGDLRGVLAAQSLPDNLVQHFAGAQDLAGTAAAFLRSGVLVAGAPGRADVACRAELLAQAMASGLVVLFDRSCPVASRLLRHGLTGVSYQAGLPDGLCEALGEVMDMPEAALEQVRGAARMHVLPMNQAGFEERLGRAMESVLRDAAESGRPGRSFLAPLLLQGR